MESRKEQRNTVKLTTEDIGRIITESLSFVLAEGYEGRDLVEKYLQNVQQKLQRAYQFYTSKIGFSPRTDVSNFAYNKQYLDKVNKVFSSVIKNNDIDFDDWFNDNLSLIEGMSYDAHFKPLGNDDYNLLVRLCKQCDALANGIDTNYGSPNHGSMNTDTVATELKSASLDLKYLIRRMHDKDFY
jgi:hypothetical protein